MKIHRAIIRHSFIHFLFSVFLFLWIEVYTKGKDAGLFYFFGYFSCLAFFTMILPLFVSDQTRHDVQAKPFFKATMVIIFLNVFVPFVGGFCSLYFFELFFQ